MENRFPNEYNRRVKLLYCVSMTACQKRAGELVQQHTVNSQSRVVPDPNDTNLVSGYLRSTTRGQKMTGHVYAVMNPWTHSAKIEGFRPKPSDV